MDASGLILFDRGKVKGEGKKTAGSIRLLGEKGSNIDATKPGPSLSSGTKIKLGGGG